jgi:HSP20 family protein
MLPMYRTRGSAMDALVDVSREMDRLASSMWGEGNDSGRLWAMPAEVVETDEEIRFDIEAPGFRPDDIDITIENNVLTISGEKKMEQEEGRKDSDYRLFERRYGRFQRSFSVPPTVRADETRADYDNGVLTVRLPKSEEAKPRRIQVSAGSSGRQIESRKKG